MKHYLKLNDLNMGNTTRGITVVDTDEWNKFTAEYDYLFLEIQKHIKELYERLENDPEFYLHNKDYQLPKELAIKILYHFWPMDAGGNFITGEKAQ